MVYKDPKYPARRNAALKTKRDAWRDGGLCTNCGRPRGNDYRKTCDRCYEYLKEKKQCRRREVIDHYGGKCVCCNETHLEFLHVDHVDTPGSVERAEAKAKGLSPEIYTRLARQGFPEGYQILCANCNHSLAHYGYCPHRPEITRQIRSRGRRLSS